MSISDYWNAISVYPSVSSPDAMYDGSKNISMSSLTMFRKSSGSDMHENT